MKKTTISAFLLGFATLALFSFTALYEPKNATAEVDQFAGIYVFKDSKPVKETEFLGTEKVGFSMSGSYEDVRDKMIKKVRKDYPSAEAIILRDGKADVVKFK